MSRRTLVLICGTLSLLTLVAACSNGDLTATAGTGTVHVRLTDAPSDIIASAEVSISSVLLVPSDDDGNGDDDGDGDVVASVASGAVELLAPEESPKLFDLLDLQDGVEAFLAEKPVAEDVYEQLRLVVDHATVTLVDGYTFADGSNTRTLFVPSGMQSGIKVQLADAIVAEEGTVTIVVVDFDVDKSFVQQGPPDAVEDVHGFLFTPSLVESRRDVEGI